MIGLFIRSLTAHVRAGKTLFLLTLLGVALGVASVLSIQIINRNALGAFEGSLRAISGDAQISVLGSGPQIDEAFLPRVLETPGVGAARPVYRIDVALAGADRTYLTVVGVDLFVPLRVPWASVPVDPAAPLREPGWVAVSPELAEERALGVGKSFGVSSGSRSVELKVGALVDFRRLTPMAGTRLVVMDIAQAQHLFGGAGRIHQIDVVLADGADPEEVRVRLEEALGPEVQARTPEQRQEAAAGLLGAFRLNLTALSLVSLFVGAFLVYTSTQASLVRRRNELGVLRCLGAGRAQLLGLILGEVAVLGVLGVAIGLALGYGVAAASVERVGATLQNLYMLEAIESLRIPGRLFVLGALVGIGSAVAGALGPAWEMSRRDPRALLAAYTVHERTRVGATPMLIAGLVVLAGAAAVYLLFGGWWRPTGFAVGVGLLIGLPLTTPWLVREATRRLPVRGFGLAYGVKALGLRLQTASFAVAALAIAVSLLVGVTLMIGSFRRTVEIWIGDTLRADVYVTSESWRRARGSATLDDELVAALTATPGVRHADRLRQFFHESRGRRISLVGIDMGIPEGESRLALLTGDPVEAFRRARDEGAVIISEPLARKAELGVGDALVIDGPFGELSFPVAGISYDYSNESGGAAMDLATMERAFGPGSINNVALYLEENRDPERIVDELKARFAGLPLLIRSNATLREEVFRIFDQTFAVTRLLQGMSLLIAVCGITLTLLVLARERLSELALYRSLGADRGQIFRVFLGKGLGIAGFGLLLGAVGGVGLAMILIYLINRAYFGWTIAVHWPGVKLFAGAVWIVAAAALASIYPALRASRTPATELSRENL